MERIVEIPDSVKRTKVEPFGMASLTGWPVREEIVRCKDCKRYSNTSSEYIQWCARAELCTEPNGFCAWGERRGQLP